MNSTGILLENNSNMDSIRPIKPEECFGYMPLAVIQAVNRLLINNIIGGEATFTFHQVKQESTEMGIEESEFKPRWFSVIKDVYMKEGWNEQYLFYK